MPTQVNQSTFLADTVILLRDEILDNITDPISASRNSTQKFVITSYPRRNVTYPVVTVIDRGISDWRQSGMQSTISVQRLGIEIRIWARSHREKDELSQQVMDRLRSRVVTFSSTEKLHGMKIDSMENVDEPGENGIKSKIINISFLEILEN